jgi:hypothetical protein
MLDPQIPALTHVNIPSPVDPKYRFDPYQHSGTRRMVTAA